MASEVYGVGWPALIGQLLLPEGPHAGEIGRAVHQDEGRASRVFLREGGCDGNGQAALSDLVGPPYGTDSTPKVNQPDGQGCNGQAQHFAGLIASTRRVQDSVSQRLKYGLRQAHYSDDAKNHREQHEIDPVQRTRPVLGPLYPVAAKHMRRPHQSTDDSEADALDQALVQCALKAQTVPLLVDLCGLCVALCEDDAEFLQLFCGKIATVRQFQGVLGLALGIFRKFDPDGVIAEVAAGYACSPALINSDAPWVNTSRPAMMPTYK